MLPPNDDLSATMLDGALNEEQDRRYPDAPGGNTITKGKKYEAFVYPLLNPFGITAWHAEDKRRQMFMENQQGIEIKLDEGCVRYGRLSIEVAEKSRADNPNWVASGILKDDNTWLYVQGNYERSWVFAKSWLLRVYQLRLMADAFHESYGTVRKFYISLEAANVGAALIINCKTRKRWGRT